MQKFEGIVVSDKMQKTATVLVVRRFAHKLYKKVLKRSKRYKVDTGDFTVKVGDKVQIIKVRPISKDKNFKILKIVNSSADVVLTKQAKSVKKEKK